MFPQDAKLLWLSVAVVLTGCQEKAPTSRSVPEAGERVDLSPVLQGRQIKLVWVQNAEPGVADPAGRGTELQLMSLDSEDGSSARRLTKKKQNYFRPLISRDGSTVVFTERSAQPHIFSIPWQGGTAVNLGSGVAVAVWVEPGTSQQFVYALDQLDEAAAGGLIGKRLFRFPIKTPGEREIIWEQAPVDVDGFQLSRNGKRACALLPAPEASIMNLEAKSSKKLPVGVWPAMAPDNSYVTWVLDADRGALEFNVPSQADSWKVSVSASDKIGGGRTIWHPRWSNNPGLITFTGSYPRAPNHPSFKAASDALQAEICIARVSPGATDMVRVMQVTKNAQGVAYPDLWVADSESDTLGSFVQVPREVEPTKLGPWPVDMTGVQFVFDSAARDVPIPRENGTRLCKVVGKQSSKLGRFWQMDVSRGYFEGDQESNQAIGRACAESGAFSVEAILTESRQGYGDLSVRLLSYRQADGSEALGLYRVETSLIARVRLGGKQQALVYPVKLGGVRIENDRPYHLVVTCDGQILTTYFNGAIISQIQLERGGLGDWTSGVLQIGDPRPLDEKGWRGGVDGVAVFSRALTADEIAKNYSVAQEKISVRKPSSRIKISGKLEQITALPEDALRGPYSRVLTARTYSVKKVQAGTYESGKSMVVFHDAVINRQPVAGLPDKIGETYPLEVEPVSQHPELKATEKINLSTAVELEEYLEVSPPQRLP